MEQRVSSSSDLGLGFEEILLDYNSLSGQFQRNDRTLLDNVRNPVVAPGWSHQVFPRLKQLQEILQVQHL